MLVRVFRANVGLLTLISAGAAPFAVKGAGVDVALGFDFYFT